MKLTNKQITNLCNDITNELSSSYLANKYKISITYLNEIKKRYLIYGLDGVLHKHKKRKFSTNFKVDICKRILNSESIHSIAKETNINHGVIYAWYRKYQQMGYNGLNNKIGRPRKEHMPKNNKQSTPLLDYERDELNKLREENQELKMENEILKKLNALVQERIKRETPKK